MPRKRIAARDKRDKLLQVLMNDKEFEKLDKAVEELNWTRSAIVRYGVEYVFANIGKLKGVAPRGNRRMSPVTAPADPDAPPEFPDDDD